MTSPAGTETIRAFIAIAVPPAIVEDLRTVQTEVGSKLRSDGVRWTGSEHLHLTLRFLGEVRTARLKELIVAMERACEDLSPFRLVLEGIGCFPDVNRPRVIWVGVKGDLNSLRRVRQRVVQATAGFGNHAEDTVFHPHLTLGRINERTSKSGRVGDRWQPFLVPKLGAWQVSEVDLMESRLSPKGARYRKLAVIALATNPNR